MNKIIEYKVNHSVTLYELKRCINSWIKQGWQPLGGIAVIARSEGMVWKMEYYQAMVRYENPELVVNK